MITLKINDETAPLEAVLLGIAENFGGTPKPDDTYDPKSLFHVQEGTFPTEENILTEMAAFDKVLKKYGVDVYRPHDIAGLNQVFSRDIGIVIGDRFIVPSIQKNRRAEIEGIQYLIDQMDPERVLYTPEHTRMEGGDVMPYGEYLFVGYSKQPDFDEYLTGRTNEAGVQFLQTHFPDRKVMAFELRKSDDDPYVNALHLDCCFQPVGTKYAIIHREGFKNPEDADWLVNLFGQENVLEIDRREMYTMCANVFSISPQVVVSEKGFFRVNGRLREWGLTVEEIPYAEISKMEGLLRCSTLPLRRKYD
ncbi:MAG: arginine deiminase family protein [Cyclobacteriaceae bacterium]|nr:arginine deiminase family protein [Cyclobacteriaceae bacterium]